MTDTYKPAARLKQGGYIQRSDGTWREITSLVQIFSPARFAMVVLSDGFEVSIPHTEEVLYRTASQQRAVAVEVTVHCCDIELDNGESLKDLGVGNYLELRRNAAGMRPGTWLLVEYHGEFHDRATLRRPSAEEIAAYRQAESEKLAALFAPTASTKAS